MNQRRPFTNLRSLAVARPHKPDGSKTAQAGIGKMDRLHRVFSIARLLIVISMIAAPLMPSQGQLAQLDSPLADLAKELAPSEAQASALNDVTGLSNNQIQSTVHPEENLVVNGSFQMGPIVTNATTRVPGWAITAGNVDIYNAYTGPDDSDRELYVSGNTRGTIEQTVTGLVAGQSYFFEFDYMSEGNVAATGSVQLIDSGNVDVLNQALSSPSDANNGGWIPFRQTFTAPADGQIKIQFIALTPATNNGISVDDVRISRRLTNYLQNGSFESGPVIVNATTRIPGWTVAAGNVDIYNNYFRPDGSTRYLFVNGNTPGTIEQSVSGLTAGQSYSLDFEYTSENNSSTLATLKVLNSSALPIVTQALTSTNDANTRGWQHFRTTFTAPGDGIAKVQFAGLSIGSVGLAVDNVRLAATPLNWVVNGDFEAGPTALNIANNAIPGWTVTTGPVDIVSWNLLYGKVVDLNGTPGNGKLEQTVTGLTAGQVYAFQLNFSSNGNATRYAVIRLLDSSSGTVMSRRVACDHDSSYQGWCTLRHSFTAPADGIVKIVLENDETDGNTQAGIMVENVLITRDLNYVINGNFSSGPTGLNQAFVPGWSIVDNPDIHDGPAGSNYRFTIELNGTPGSVTARQNLSGLTSGQSYTLRYMYMSGADSINAQFSTQVLPVSGAALVTVTQSTGLNGTPANNGWREARHTFTAPADGQVSIVFRDIESDGNTSYGVFIDNVSVFGTTTVANVTLDVCSTSAPLSVTVAPGGVTNGLQFWVRADKNTFNNTNGTAAAAGDLVKRWDDLSGYGLDMIPTSGREATYRAGTAQTNYNPYLDFLNDYMVNYSQIMPVQSDMTMLAAGYKTANGGIDTIFSTGDNGNDPTLDVTNLDFNPWSDASSPAYVTHIGSPIVQSRMYVFDMRAQNGVSNDLIAGLSGRDHANNMEILGDNDLYMFRKANIASDGGGENWDGAIVESILYSRELSGTELARVRSYMAIRNGVTLDISPTSAAAGQNYDYLDSSSVTIWAGNTTQAAYHFDVTGIGRDDASMLDQRKSKSVNGDDPVTMNSGGAFSADKSFLVWGNNNGAASFATSYTPDSFSPTVPYYSMARIWKAQESGTVGLVSVELSVGADYMIVDTDGDGNFATGTQDEVAISGGTFDYNFDSNDYFTFIAPAVAPGGVAGNLTAWYKANEGAESGGNAPTDGVAIDTWRDQGLEANDAFQSTTSLKPEWLSNNGKFNFNPAVTFVPDARLQAQFNVSSWSNSDGSIYVIYNQEKVKTGWRNLVDFGLTAGDSNNPQVGMSDNDRIATWMDGFDRDNTTFQPVPDETRLAGYYWQFNVGGHTYTYDGQPHTGAAGHKIGTTGIDIGNFANIGGDPQLGEYFPGQIAEIAIYKEQHNAAAQAKVQSYFAIKYGVTLDANPSSGSTNFDYVNSASTVIWAGNTTNATYHNDVTGIGRDDASELDQRKSKSLNGDDPIIMDSNGAFATDKAFAVWGNNNLANTLSANYAGGTNNRLARVWKVQETGTVGPVKLIIPRSAFPGAGLRTLIVHTSNAFATVDRTYALTSRGGNYEVLVDFNNNDFFTFSTSSTLPEIDVTPTVVDFGTVNTGITSTAQAVTIQNLGDVALSLGSINLSGGDAPQFAISSNTCGASISPGGSCTVSLTFRPASSGAKSAQLVINSGDSDEPTVKVALLGSGPDVTTSLNKYNLAVLKSSSVLTATAGTPFNYTITVRNKGTVAASNVVATDTLPAGVTFNAATATGGGTCTHLTGVVTCNWPSLAAGASATVTITVTP